MEMGKLKDEIFDDRSDLSDWTDLSDLFLR